MTKKCKYCDREAWHKTSTSYDMCKSCYKAFCAGTTYGILNSQREMRMALGLNEENP